MVAHSKKILILFILLALGCAILIPMVNVNKDMTKYLPEDSSMRQGLDLMRTEFGEENASTLEVMFSDLKTQKEKDSVLAQLEDIKNVSSVDYSAEDKDKDHYYNKGKYTRFIINCDHSQYSDEAAELWQSVKTEFEGTHEVTLGGTVNSANDTGLPLWIVVVAFLLVIAVLVIMAGSWIEPVAFLITIGIAILINMGTYALFPSISNTTFGIVAILQLALSIDYSIMLLNRYRQQRQIIPDKKEAMEQALSLSFGAITGSSLTTFAGLLALVFMSFTIGADVGIALAKGVIISLICIFTVLPALLLGFDSLMLKTAKHSIPTDLPKLSGFMHRMRLPLTLLFAVMLIGSFIFRNGVDFSYSQSWLTDIDKVFGHTNNMVMLYDERDGKAAGRLAEKLDKNKNVHSAVCYESSLGKQRTVPGMRDFIKDMEDESGSVDTGGMELSVPMLRLIYYDYHRGAPSFRLTIPRFVSFFRNEVADDPDFGDAVDKETRDQLDDMAEYTDRGKLTSQMNAAGLAGFFDMKTSQAGQLLLYYQIENNRSGSSMDLPGFVSFLINDVADDPDYGSAISSSQLKELKSIKVFTSKKKMTSPVTYRKAANILGIGSSQMRLVYVNHMAGSKDTSRRTISSLASLLSDMAADPMLKKQFGGKDTARLIAGLKQIGQMDPSSYDIADMARALKGYRVPLDKKTLSFVYSYGDISSDAGSHKMSVQEAVHAMDNERLAELERIIDTSVSGKKLSAGTMASVLGMNTSDVNKIYLLNQYKNGDTGAWSLTPQQFVNFLVDKVLSDSSMRTKIGSSASDLKTAQKLINNVVNETGFTFSGMTDMFSDYSSDLEKSDMSLLYTLYGSRHYFKEKWTMDLMQLVTHLDRKMISKPAFAKHLDRKQIKDIHDARADMDEAAELLKGEHYGRMMITATMDEDSDETRAFMKETSGWTDSHFNEKTYMIGNTPMAWEMSKTFRHELNKITLITALFILLIVLLTFRRFLLSVLLVLVIQCAVFLTMAFLNFIHFDMQYMALLVVQSIMMGATIDYAIIYTTYYGESRASMAPREAVRTSYKGALQTILTSATILIAAVGVISFAFADPAIRQICRILSIGSLFATLLVVFVLPAMLACLDRFTAPKNSIRT